jgi:hypothetical protein
LAALFSHVLCSNSIETTSRTAQVPDKQAVHAQFSLIMPRPLLLLPGPTISWPESVPILGRYQHDCAIAHCNKTCKEGPGGARGLGQKQLSPFGPQQSSVSALSSPVPNWRLRGGRKPCSESGCRLTWSSNVILRD